MAFVYSYFLQIILHTINHKEFTLNNIFLRRQFYIRVLYKLAYQKHTYDAACYDGYDDNDATGDDDVGNNINNNNNNSRIVDIIIMVRSHDKSCRTLPRSLLKRRLR